MNPNNHSTLAHRSHRTAGGLRRPLPAQRPARGMATLAIVTVLVLVATLAVIHAGRLATDDLRAAASQARATAAFEAAEAGLAFALEGLNRTQRIDAACRPSDSASAPTVRDLLVMADDAPPHWRPTGRDLACQRMPNGGWQCRCTDAAAAVRVAADDLHNERPTFRVTVQAGDAPGTLRLVARGCSHAARPCLADAAHPADASTEVQLQVGWLPALARTPVAAITARGVVTLGGGFRAVNTEPESGGLTVHAGGAVQAGPDALQTTAGAPAAASVAANDPALQQAGGAPVDADTFFLRLFSLSRQRLQALPGVLRLDCRSAACSAAQLRQALSRSDAAMAWINGTLALDDAGSVGTPEHPVLLVVDGAVQWQGTTRVHGVVYTSAGRLEARAGAVDLRGALLAEGDVDAAGLSAVTHDGAVLQALARRAGAFVSLPGSWRDFTPTAP